MAKAVVTARLTGTRRSTKPHAWTGASSPRTPVLGSWHCRRRSPRGTDEETEAREVKLSHGLTGSRSGARPEPGGLTHAETTV